MSAWLLNGFLESLERYPDRPALLVDGQCHSYSDLAVRAQTLAAAPVRSDKSITAVLSARTTDAYAAVLAALFKGNTYMPLNPRFPVPRLAFMMRHSGCDQIISDAAHLNELGPLLAELNSPISVVIADRDDVSDIQAHHSRHRIFPGLATDRTPKAPVRPSPESAAYLLYTSGSTGTPKGVAVSHANVSHFLGVCAERYDFVETDRFSQMFDLGFDLSVFDLFVAWSAGGCVCVPQQGEQMLPTQYIERSKITVWFSVPSTGVLLNRLRILKPSAFPNLRWALFCGEALPSDIAEAWALAAPNAVVENLYGPTEATIACTAYRWKAGAFDGSTVPIGYPFKGLSAKVVDKDLNEVRPGELGELIVFGPQVALGYWRDDEKTALAFGNDRQDGGRYYRTGDLVRRPQEDRKPLIYAGRIDHQVKLHGQRIELGEIESVLRSAAGASACVVVPIRSASGAAEALVAFVECDQLDAEALRAEARRRLPDYMVPREFRQISHLPLNANGKVDRNALTALLGNVE